MLLYIKNSHTHTPKNKKPLELINEFYKVAEYKFNIQKSIVYLDTSNKQSENKIKKIIPFTIAPKNTKE